ncbi:uncharacterized protein LOC110459004 [Mizuhopecten yessoensis]|uniref:uncharacterized protein LOC110459004 n=1 Tax=Mizuhopecten yessoensis TaxID=6573 RepID=UPI000B45C277|nr:uncharacterized protein LOC110459004 [Mizuhopecten yessoensis]
MEADRDFGKNWLNPVTTTRRNDTSASNDHSSDVSTEQKYVAVIGAGVSGLCAIKHLLTKQGQFKPTAFERNSRIGGTWAYSESTVDAFGLPEHSCLYKNLWSNNPKQLLTFQGFPHDQSGRSYIDHNAVLKYLEDFSQHNSLADFIQVTNFNCGVIITTLHREPAYIREMCILNENLTAGCSDVTMMQIRTFQYMFEQLVMSSPTCSWMVTEDVRKGSDRLLAGGDMINEDGVIQVLQDQMRSWQEAVLGSVKAMQDAYMVGDMRNDKDEEDRKADDMDEEDREKDEMDKEDCRPRGATECYLTAISTVTAEDWVGPSFDNFCRKLEGMYGCMKKEMAGCMEWQQVMVRKLYSETHFYYNSVCEEDKMAYMAEDSDKYAFAIRGYLLSTEGCDWAKSMVFKMMANHTMRKMGDKCQVHVEEHCRDQRSCDPVAITRCYRPIQLHVAAIIDDKLPANVHVCEQLAVAAKCVERLHCDERTMYRVHETMEPALSKLTKMCYKMPVQTCITSSMWKMAAIVLLNKKTYETSYALGYMKMHMYDDRMNMSRNNTTSANTTKPDDVMNDGKWSEEGMAKALMTLQHILSRDNGCSKDMEVDGDLATGLKYLVRYAFMYEKMVETDENFMNMMTLAMAGELRNAVGDSVGGDFGSNNQELGDLIKMVRDRFDDRENMTRNNMTMHGNTTRNNATVPGYNMTAPRSNTSMEMDWKLRDVIGRIITHLIVYGNSDTFMQVETHKVVKAKMMKAIEMAKMRGNDLELEERDEDAFERLDLNLGKDLENAVDWEMMNILKTVYDVAMLESSNLTMNHTMELLEMAQHIHAYRKQELCMSMVGAWQCTSSTLMLLPESVRGMVNQTLNSLYSITGHFCEELKCYSCDNFHDNEACNKQAMVTCKPGQVCFTHVDNGEMKKGCAAPAMGDWQKDKEMYSTCMGHGCNHPKFGTRKEAENEMCQPFKAIGCMYELLPTMLQGQEVDYREAYKAFHCMESYTSSCIMEEHRELSRMAQRVKVAMTDGQCSQPDFVHTCGLSSILELADLVKTPAASRKTICTTLNQTVSNVMLANYWNQCTEYEMVMTYNELNMISSVIGPDFCPGIDPRNPQKCAEERAKLPPMCNLEEAIGKCLYEADVLHKMVEILGDPEEWRDMDFLCSRLEHMLGCVGNYTSSCDDAQMQYVHQIVGERIGKAIPHCPSLNIELAMCDATPLSEYNCMIYEGIEACLQPTEVYKNPYNLCSMNETMFDDVLTCLHGYTKHCTAVQALPVTYIVQNYMAQSLILCGNHSMATEIAQGITNHEQGVAMETMMNMMMGKASGMMQDNEDAPITSLVNVILSLKTKITMTGNVTDMLMALMNEMGEDKEEGMKGPSDKTNLMSMMKVSMGMAMHVSGLDTKRIYHTDVTHDVARCVSQYSMAVQRLLLYPEVSHQLACEGKAVFRKCLKKLQLPPVANMFVMALESKVAMESERDCNYYLDDVMLLGRDIANVTSHMRMIINATGAYENATAAAIALKLNTTILQRANLTKEERDLITIIIGMMSNMTSRNRSMDGLEDAPKEVVMTLIKGVVSQFHEIVTVTSDCNAWMISQHITFAYMQVLTGAFYPYSQYPGMCSNLKTVYETLKPEVLKCPVNYQVMYDRALTFLHSETSEICDLPYIDNTPPTTCNAELVSHCIVDLMPLLSTAGTERKRLCMAVEQASLCMAYGLRHCNDTQSLAPYLQFEHIKSIVADSCPFLTASMQCFNNDDIITGNTQLCNVTMPSKIPDMMNCLYRYTLNCSALEMTVAYTHLHIVLEDIVNVCNNDSMISAYREATKSDTCNQAEQCTITQVAARCGTLIPDSFSSCSSFNNLNTCLTGLIKGCNTLQLTMVHTGLSSMLSNAQMACIDVVPLTSMIQYEKDAARSVIACVNNYTLEMTSALMNTDDAHQAICTAFANLGQCFTGDMTEEAAAEVWPYYGTSSNVTWGLVRELCWSNEQAANMARSQMGAMYNYMPDRKMNDMQKEGPTCDIQNAAKILSSYSVVVMFSSLLSAEDKNDFCDAYV